MIPKLWEHIEEIGDFFRAQGVVGVSEKFSELNQKWRAYADIEAELGFEYLADVGSQSERAKVALCSMLVRRSVELESWWIHYLHAKEELRLVQAADGDKNLASHQEPE
jgi:hypothetical protein